MALRVYGDKDKTDLVCDTGPENRKCAIEAGTALSIDVIASGLPLDGYSGYQVVLSYSFPLTLQQQPGLEENVWPDCQDADEFKKEEGIYRIRCKGRESRYKGPLVNVQFECDPQGGQTKVVLVRGAGTRVSWYSTPFGELLWLSNADSVLINCVAPTPTNTPIPVDTDLDGCNDGAELGGDPGTGGMRNPNHFWDFFDTNTENSLGAGGHLAGNISLEDIFNVASHFGQSGDPAGDPLSDASNFDQYHTRFDRGGQIGANAWNQAAADGSITITDIFAVAGQFGHACA
jgi:hypothetical protein